MKTILLIALSSIILTGCVSQSDYDNLKNENDKLNKEISRLSVSNNDLETQVSSLKEINESLKAEIEEYEREQEEPEKEQEDSVSGVTVSPTESTIASNTYHNKDAGTISYILNRDEKNRLSLIIYYDLDSDTESTDHELKHGMCVGGALSKFKPYVMETESLYSMDIFSTDRQYDYCEMWISSSKVLPIISAQERDGKATTESPKWINDIESYITAENAESILWIDETIGQIDKEISAYF